MMGWKMHRRWGLGATNRDTEKGFRGCWEKEVRSDLVERGGMAGVTAREENFYVEECSLAEDEKLKWSR